MSIAAAGCTWASTENRRTRMALTIFRRHLKRCAQTDRYFRRCSCPISVEGTLAGEEVRKALNLTSWEAAQNLIAEWNRAGKIGAELQKKKTPAEAIAAFLLDAEIGRASCRERA